MVVDKELIVRVAHLSRLELSEEEMDIFQPELDEVLNSFSELRHVDTDDTEPKFHPVKIKNSMREDHPKPGLSQKQALMNSPYSDDGYIKGPRAA
jgi:aspartyl-tRNA(Asn)/glutamyl-tRNA(Gln) amidotransferase subunit C